MYVSSSVSFPILVNRGWVPRSWKDKFLEASEDEDLEDALPSPSHVDGSKSWWRFWSKKPVIEVASPPNHIHIHIHILFNAEKKLNLNFSRVTYRIRLHLLHL